jgi:hypothetical protein
LHRESVVVANHEVIVSGGQIYRTGQLDFGIVEIIAGIEAVLQIGECGVIQKRTDIISGRCGTSWLSPRNGAKVNCTADKLGTCQSGGHVQRI